MTSPLISNVMIEAALKTYRLAVDKGYPSDAAMDGALRSALALFPEGRSEQDQGGVDPALAAETFRIAVGWQERCGKAEADLSAARLRIKALEEALGELHKVTMAGMRADRKQVAKKGPGRELYDRVEALLSSAQGETKEGFDGLPELPCGSRDEAGLGATAALAKRVEVLDPEGPHQYEPDPEYPRCCVYCGGGVGSSLHAAPDAAALVEGE